MEILFTDFEKFLSLVVRLRVFLVAVFAVRLLETAAVSELKTSDVAAVLVVPARSHVEPAAGGSFFQNGVVLSPVLRRRPGPLLRLLADAGAFLLLWAGVGGVAGCEEHPLLSQILCVKAWLPQLPILRIGQQDRVSEANQLANMFFGVREVFVPILIVFQEQVQNRYG